MVLLIENTNSWCVSIATAIKGLCLTCWQEMSTSRRAAGLREKVPDIRRTLDMVEFLDSKKVCNSELGNKPLAGLFLCNLTLR